MSLLNRPDEIRARLKNLAARKPWRVAFHAFDETAFINYFSPALFDDLKLLERVGLSVVPYSTAPDAPAPDIVFLTAHGNDGSGKICDIRRRFPDAMIAAWFWDNQNLTPDNMRTAVAADLIFASHAYAVNSIVNPLSALAGHVPACSAQWPLAMANALYKEFEQLPRSSQLLVNYVDYDSSWRSPLLRALGPAMPEADVMLMKPDDRSRYFGKPPAERMREWMGYKSALILPADRDVSTRVFDGLLAGQVLVMPRDDMPDLAQILHPGDEEKLGIVRLPNLTIPAIKQGAGLAVSRFDQGGIAGARVRHEWVMKSHMLVHRVDQALSVVRGLVDGALSVKACAPPNLPFGLYVLSPAA